MADNEEFTANLLRLIAAELRFSNGMAAAREMYGKGYFSLGVGEKEVVDRTVTGMVGANFHFLTAEYFAAPPAPSPVGFHVGQQPASRPESAPSPSPAQSPAPEPTAPTQQKSKE